MARINLLPWRAALRKQRKLEFLSALGVVAVLAVVVWFGIHLFYTDHLEYQNGRNAYIQAETAKLDAQIREIQELEKEKQRLIARMKAIESLQSSRPLIVRIFDEIVNTLPEGVYLTAVTQTGDSLQITGVAESNARVSSLMRNIEKSAWLTTPKLQIIESADNSGRRIARFTLTLKQASTQSGKDGEPMS